MKTTVTEGQKRLIMGIITVVLCIVMGMNFIKPMNATIKENREILEAEEKTADDMRTLINNTTLEGKYQDLKTSSEITFKRNYQSFKANEKVEEIFNQFNVDLKSISISEYHALDTNSYEMNVVQPTEVETYMEMYQIMQGPKMQLFLVSEVTVNADATDDQFFQLLNAINNVQPEGPGDGDMSRYCLQIPTVSYNRTNSTVDWTISMYGMQPPPVDAAEIED